MQEQDPLADATYIRANFTYIPRTPKELQIKAGDIFHIHDEVRVCMCVCVSCIMLPRCLYTHNTHTHTHKQLATYLGTQLHGHIVIVVYSYNIIFFPIGSIRKVPIVFLGVPSQQRRNGRENGSNPQLNEGPGIPGGSGRE